MQASHKQSTHMQAGNRPLRQNTPSMKTMPSNGAISTMANRSLLDKIRSNPRPLILVVLALIVVFLLNSILSNPNIYKGVTVGDLDVSGMTKEEASAAISAHFAPHVESTQVTIYAGDEGREKVLSGEQNQIGPEEQLSVEDVQEHTYSWTVANTDVGAYVDSNALAEKAYQVGRDNGGFLSRLGSFLFGTKLTAEVSFDEGSLESLASKIDAVMGYSRVDWNIAIDNGFAYVTEGSNGLMTNRDTLKTNLSNAFIGSNNSDGTFTAYVEDAPVRIDESAAQEAADKVNDAIADGAAFTYEKQSWTATASNIGDWVSSTVAKEGDSWVLDLGIKKDSFSSDLFAHFSVGETSDGIAVSFEVDGDNVTVHTNCVGSMPQVESARAALESTLFENGGKKNTGTPATITVDSGPVPEYLTFDEALESGIISAISSYTTTYTTGSGTEARNTNIHIGASYINNSVCKAGGEEWSFNGLVGDTTPDKGYQAAGSIAQGEYVDTYGGGICQVATTVFNALFESPYKILKRYNHSLYIASYPTGRDAAISWDYLDLTWCNESTSDVLMKASCNEDDITVTLYSVPCKFSVTSDVGDWEEGEKYTITVQTDENLAKGYSYVKQSGTDGSKISVVRNVYDAKGNLVYSNTFASTYLPKEEIIVAGPDTEVDTER